MKKNKPVLKADLKTEYKDDSVLSYHLKRFLLLALELADVEDEKEIERIQKNFLDNY